MPTLTDLMPITPDWGDIAIRIAATLVAGGLIGMDREKGGHAAGFRTTILVGLAACISMIQANLLLSTSQQANGSMDILRFPLGILTGVGFIGGGAILRRGDIATGVTTAATLWLITAIGLCFGGGQLVAGAAATIVAFVVLSPLKTIGLWLSCEQKGSVSIRVARGAGIPDIAGRLPQGSEAFLTGIRPLDGADEELVYELRWHSTHGSPGAADIVKALRTGFEVTAFEHRSAIT
ncbi:MgtC/SapB family protein [Rhizobium binxianense]